MGHVLSCTFLQEFLFFISAALATGSQKIASCQNVLPDFW
jgi:hypothetical protein